MKFDDGTRPFQVTWHSGDEIARKIDCDSFIRNDCIVDCGQVSAYADYIGLGAIAAKLICCVANLRNAKTAEWPKAKAGFHKNQQ